MTTVELAAMLLWRSWGEWAKATRCSECGDFVYCRAHRRSGPWLCLECFDLSTDAERLLR